MTEIKPRMKTFFVLYENFGTKFSCIVNLDADLLRGRGIVYVKQRVREKEVITGSLTIIDLKPLDI